MAKKQTTYYKVVNRYTGEVEGIISEEKAFEYDTRIYSLIEMEPMWGTTNVFTPVGFGRASQIALLKIVDPGGYSYHKPIFSLNCLTGIYLGKLVSY